MVMHDIIKQQIANALKEAFKKSFALELETTQLYESFTLAPNQQMGQLAFPCFRFAKELKKSPPQIAKEALDNLEKTEFIEKALATGPYINFFISNEYAGKKILEQISTGEFYQKTILENTPKAMIEYFQPNTHKEVHVGHLRNLCLGETVINLHKYCNYNITSVTYPGDSGAHIAKVLWYLKKFDPKIIDGDKGAQLGDLYSTANKLLEDERGTDKEESNKEILTNILKEIHNQKGEYFELWKKTRGWSLDHMKSICDWAGVEFDRWYFESELDAPSLEYMHELYKQGKLVKDQGAIGMDLSQDKLSFCLLVKSDGNGLYATKDIELAKIKFQEFGIEKNIYIVDKRQSHHFKQVFKVLERLGFEHANKCYHLGYEFVTLPDGAISSRSGNIVSAVDVISSVENSIQKNFLARYTDWSEEQKQKVAYEVSLGAIKYGMLSIEPNKEIVFDMDSWTKIDGESGPYIQYAHARICSLLDKIEFDEKAPINTSSLTHKRESALIFKLSQFNNIIEDSCQKYRPSTLCTYLYELAKEFNGFYGDCSVANAESDELKNARAYLSFAVARTIKEGLRILGIPAPRKM